MNTLSEQAQRVIGSVRLKSIRLQEANVRAGVPWLEESAPAKAEVSYGAEIQGRSGSSLLVLASFTFDGLIADDGEGGGSDTSGVSVQAKFQLAYELPDAFDAAEDELEAFAAVNGIFNSWSYFREYLDNSLARMALPPFCLPLFRLSDLNPQGEGGDESSGQKLETNG